jgi:hypothetical protein
MIKDDQKDAHVDSNDVCHGEEGRQAGTQLRGEPCILDCIGLWGSALFDDK